MLLGPCGEEIVNSANEFPSAGTTQYTEGKLLPLSWSLVAPILTMEGPRTSHD
jgi:hypothetical protein